MHSYFSNMSADCFSCTVATFSYCTHTEPSEHIRMGTEADGQQFDDRDCHVVDVFLPGLDPKVTGLAPA